MSSSHEAIKVLQREAAEGRSFALVLVDQLMPGMDGFELLEKLQEESQSAGQVVMMLSSYDGPQKAQRGKGPRIDGFFLKPVNESDLLNSIQAALAGTETSSMVRLSGGGTLMRIVVSFRSRPLSL